MKNIFYHNQHSIDLAVKLEASRDDILDRWRNDRVAGYILSSHKIDQGFFVKHFGSKVLDYFIKVLKDEEKIGQCPVIIVLLKFFAKKKITLQELFLCCSGLKNSVTSTFVESQSTTNMHQLRALQVVFDLNFSGVIQEYIELGYCTVQCKFEMHSPPENIHETINLDELEEVLQEENLNKQEKSHALELYATEEIHEFFELQDELVYLTDKFHQENIFEEDTTLYADKLAKYAGNVLRSPEFFELGESLYELSHFFSNTQNTQTIQNHLSEIALLMDCFINDLVLWKVNLFETRKDDIHCYDDSIISNVKQIIIVLDEDKASSDGCEFF